MAKKTLVIVESPKKSRIISKYLGKDYIVQASIGHVSDLVNSGKNNMGIDIDNGFKPKYMILPDKKDKIRTIVKAAKQANQVLIATDPDREGEAIGYHLAEILQKINNNIKRVEFNEVTPDAVRDAINSPRNLDENLYNAQQARRVLDRIVGFSVSPYLKDKFGQNLSAGRVQSVALRMVVDREREIEAFDPQPYWTINAQVAKSEDSESFTIKYSNTIKDEKTAKLVKKELDSDDYVVSNVYKYEKEKKPQPPLITSTLCANAYSKYKFQSARTMKAAQSLYETGMITYMRTDSVRVSDKAIDMCRHWLDENGLDKPETPNIYSANKDAQDAHEAIRPTNIDKTPKNVYLAQDEQKIYTIIWEGFVASQMKSAIYDTVDIIVKTSSNHELKVSGKTLKYKGWIEIGRETKKDKNILLPPVSNGDTLILVPPKVKLSKKSTKPPSRYSEATLITALKQKGIGRPSTLPSIMAKITNKGYIMRKGNAFIPSDIGKQIVDELVEYFNFMKYEYTANMENRLDKISQGKLEYTEMLSDFYEPFASQLKKAYMSDYETFGHICDRCENNTPMLLKHGRFGFYLACYNYPDSCKNTISCDIVDGKPVINSDYSNADENVRCPNCISPMRLFHGDFGPYYSCSEWPRCKGKRKMLWGKKCPQCSSELFATIYKDQDVLFCMGYSNGCRYSEHLPEGTLKNPKKIVPKKKIPKGIKKIIKGK